MVRSVSVSLDRAIHRRMHGHTLPKVLNVWRVCNQVNDRRDRSLSAVYDYEKPTAIINERRGQSERDDEPCAMDALWFGENEILGSSDSSVGSVLDWVCPRLWWFPPIDRRHFHLEISVDREEVQRERSPMTKHLQNDRSAETSLFIAYRCNKCNQWHKRSLPVHDNTVTRYKKHSVHL